MKENWQNIGVQANTKDVDNNNVNNTVKGRGCNIKFNNKD